MAIKVYFDNKNYSIEESAVSSAADNLKTHLSSVMNGSGAKIKLCENYYDIDTAKLSNATNDFISNLETVSGSGFNVVVGGAEHSIDSTKVSGTIYDLHAFFDSIRAKTLAGLYKPGAIDLYNKYGASAIKDMLITSWEDLVANGSIVVTDGEVSIGTVALELPEKNEYGFYFDVPYTANNGMTLGFAFHEDGSLDIYTDGSVDQSLPAGSAIYSADSADLSSVGVGVGTFSNGGISLGLIGNTFELTLTSKFSPAGDLILPNDGSITSLGTAFSDNTAITGIIIPDSVTVIGAGAFYVCDSLTSVVIPDSVTTIGGYAFSDCPSLTSVEIPDSVTTIDNHAFRNCTSLTSVVIPDSVTTIDACAFEGCSSLTSVEIPYGVTTIGNKSFYGCTSLTSVVIPDSVTTIGYEAFWDCDSLTYVYITSVENWMNGHFDDAFSSSVTKHFLDDAGNEITELVIPDSMISIDNSAFCNFSSLTYVDIGNGVITIDESAFYQCSNLTTVVIHDSVKYINKYAFRDCSKLTDIYFTGTESQWNAITKGTGWDNATPDYTVHYNHTLG